MKSPATARTDRAITVRTFACAMVAVSLGSLLHGGQGMEWNPFLQASWAIAGALTYVLVRCARRTVKA